jgi:hypothetical protein
MTNKEKASPTDPQREERPREKKVVVMTELAEEVGGKVEANFY